MCEVVNSGVGDLPCEYVEAWEPGDLESANSGVEDFVCEAGPSMHSAEANSGLSELSVFSLLFSFLLLSCVSVSFLWSRA